jgi:hypothetical protein
MGSFNGSIHGFGVDRFAPIEDDKGVTNPPKWVLDLDR